jgi:hypothetical protein
LSGPTSGVRSIKIPRVRIPHVRGSSLEPVLFAAKISFILLIEAAGMAACGSSKLHADCGTGGNEGGSATGAAGSDADVDSGKIDVAVRYSPQCPANPAAANGPCVPAQVCEYSAPGAHPTCVTRVECVVPASGGNPSWQVTPPDPVCGTRAASCPSSFSARGTGEPCSGPGAASCDYDVGRCKCATCTSSTGDSSQGIWLCLEWNVGGDGCPITPPLSGTACITAPLLGCMYSNSCGLSVGDDYQCTEGFWRNTGQDHGGLCAIRTCPVSPADPGTNHPPDTCSQPSDCPGGTCSQQLDGSKTCVKAAVAPAPTVNPCPTGDFNCCTKDADCKNGRCISDQSVYGTSYCGHPVPDEGACSYDECQTDRDCRARFAGSAAMTACVPSGQFGLFTSTCVNGACRTDADCVLHSGGKCQYGLAATKGDCSNYKVLFCAYPSDPCQVKDNPATTCPGGQICVPADNYQGQVCGLPPPA